MPEYALFPSHGFAHVSGGTSPCGRALNAMSLILCPATVSCFLTHILGLLAELTFGMNLSLGKCMKRQCSVWEKGG